MIPPDANAAFVATMEDVLEVYQRPHDPQCRNSFGRAQSPPSNCGPRRG